MICLVLQKPDSDRYSAVEEVPADKLYFSYSIFIGSRFHFWLTLGLNGTYLYNSAITGILPQAFIKFSTNSSAVNSRVYLESGSPIDSEPKEF